VRCINLSGSDYDYRERTARSILRRAADADRGLTTALNFANFLVVDLSSIVAAASSERLNLLSK